MAILSKPLDGPFTIRIEEFFDGPFPPNGSTFRATVSVFGSDVWKCEQTVERFHRGYLSDVTDRLVAEATHQFGEFLADALISFGAKVG